MKVLIVNYNSGNLASLYNTLLKTAKVNNRKIDISISNKPEDILMADKVILPGVGDFSNCKKQLTSITGMEDSLRELVYKKTRPFMGICIGMHLMAKKSYERIETKGLGFFDSEVKKISFKDEGLKVPHMGWNDVKLENKSFNSSFDSLKEQNFYFVHSYEMICHSKVDVIATVEYGRKIVAAICKDNILGVQFHPEKSQNQGQELINDFLNWMP